LLFDLASQVGEETVTVNQNSRIVEHIQEKRAPLLNLRWRLQDRRQHGRDTHAS